MSVPDRDERGGTDRHVYGIFSLQEISDFKWKPVSFTKSPLLPPFFCCLSAVRGRQKVTGQQTPFHTEIPSYTRHLKGYKICLDPGHGGQGHISDYKRGPTGVREAEVNLQVALHLQDMLQEVGATVVMTRVDDSYVEPARRGVKLPTKVVPIFLSHFTTTALTSQKRTTLPHGITAMRTTLARASISLAMCNRGSQTHCNYRIHQRQASSRISWSSLLALAFCDSRNVQQFYVRHLFSRTQTEEARLKKDDYLRKEAYGYFLGLARYVAAGFPKGVLVAPQPETVIQTRMPRLANSDYGWTPRTRRVDAQTTAGFHRLYPN